MTWAIGACNILSGYGVVVSDIRVTCDGKSADILRKAYPIGRDLVGAFAGSVVIGFHLLDSIRQFLSLMPEEDRNTWLPVWVAENWAPIARSVFERAPDDHKRGDSQFLIIGPHPTEEIIPGRPIQHICKMQAPDFHPEITKNSGFAAIGSGAEIPRCIEAVRQALNPANVPPQVAVGHNGFHWANIFAFCMNQTLRHFPLPDVSRYMHYHLTTRGDIQLRTSNENMPPVATNLEQFGKMAEAVGLSRSAAIC